MRAPLRGKTLRDALRWPGSLWREVRVVAETGSTNADLAARALGGEAEGGVLVAELQQAGRGRLGRAWAAPAGASLTFSVLLRPGVEPARWSWLPLLAGVSVAEAVGVATGPPGAGGVDVGLKWPNDVLAGPGKLSGILVERFGDAAVVGVGLNVSQTAAELPTAGATSLALEGADVDRAGLLVAVLRELDGRYRSWRADLGDPERSGLRDAYRRRCVTLGRRVRVELPGGDALTGTATDVDAAGRLVVRTAEGERAVSAGEVVHVR